MDRRSWPWKKKSSEKTVLALEPSSSESSVVHSASHNHDQDASKILADHVRMSEDAMAQLKESEKKVKDLTEKLSAALAEISTKESLVKQHTKVAEEAVSGWEKAGAETVAAKKQVESLTEQKVALEERATHLDGALKECMKQLRHVREEQEHKIHEVIVNKTRDCEKIRCEFEAKIGVFEQQLLQVEAENTALSRSLQDRNKTLAELNEARSQAEADVKVLQVNIESYEHEMSSLKYELHLLSKELEIRNEERNMSMKSAEAANKQHLEAVKKIAKLEAECQRLRSLVRKKLPGPAALAQMKMEVETLGKDSGEGRKRRSPGKVPGAFGPPFDSGYDNSQELSQKESEFLTERLLAMEEEMKMLKEALAKRNSELQASRMMCARTASKLSSVEKQLDALTSGQKPIKPALELHVEGPRSQTTSNPPSLTSMSEDGNDDEMSCAESWASALISELSQIKKEKGSAKSDKAPESCNLHLMDDFAEMEKLASLPSPKMGQKIGKLDGSSEKGVGVGDKNSSEGVLAKRDSELLSANQQCLDLSKKLASVQEQFTELQSKNLANENALVSLQARLDMIFEVQAEGGDVQKVLQDVKYAMAEAGEALSSSNACSREQPLPSHDLDNQQCACHVAKISTSEEEGNSFSNSKLQNDVTDPKFEIIVCKVITLVESIANEARSSRNFSSSKLHGLDASIENLKNSVNQILHGKTDIIEFVTELSSVLIQLSDITLPVCDKYDFHNEENGSGSVKPENNKLDTFENGHFEPCSLREKMGARNACVSSCSSSNVNSDLTVIMEEKAALESELKDGAARYVGLQEENEKTKLENELVALKQNLTQLIDQLTEAEDTLKDLREQLASTRESKQIAENQLQIMTSSKEDLELQLKTSEVETNQLHERLEALESELQEECKHHDDAEAKCKDLQQQLQKKDEELASMQFSISDMDSKTRQDREIAATAEKIAECQQTIYFLDRKIKALTSRKDSMEDVLNFSRQSSERNERTEQDTSWSPNNHYPSGASEPDISVVGNGMHKSSWQSSVSAGRNVHDTYKNKETFSPVHAEYIDGRLTMPSSSDTEPSSPTGSPVKSTHQNNKGGNTLSKALNAGAGKPSSAEKHGSVMSRFFSRTKNSH